MMTSETGEKWLTWARQIQALAQSGLAYSKNPFDIERYEQLRELSVEIVNDYTEAGTEKVRDLFANETGYQTPKVDVRGAVILNNKILLVKEHIEQAWSLPGGWADVGLSVIENVEKEVREEAGLVVKAGKLVAVYDWLKSKPMAPFSLYKLVVLCKPIGGKFTPNIETDESGYFSPDNLPPLSHKVSTDLIEKCFEAIKDPAWQTYIE